MPILNVHRRAIAADHCGRVFFCANPADAQQCKRFIDDVLAISDCIACCDGDPKGPENADWRDMLADMQLFVVLVSHRFLSEPSRARDMELALAREKHIPILPVLTETVSLSEYNCIFPDIQYLDPKDTSEGALPYAQKLERALGEVLQNSNTRAKIQDSFDRSFFLSYRKKDRRNAQTLMEKIHSQEQFQSTAIWYDEFLLPGEDFNHSIVAAMNSSSLFLMSVTPHMLEPTNYVLNVEYPAALEKKMQIVAVETQSTDKNEFLDKFQNVPSLIPLEDEEQLFAVLGNALPGEQQEKSAERAYYLGLAYLNGISVEVNRPLGVTLIKQAAEDGCDEAVQKLINMYRCADGVERNYAEASRLSEKQIAKLYDSYIEQHNLPTFDAYLSALLELGEDYWHLGDCDSARRIFSKVKTEADRLRDAEFLKSSAKTYMNIATLRLAAVERMAGNLSEAIIILKSNLPYYRFELEESGSNSDRQALAVLLNELANVYIESGKPEKAEKFAKEAMELNETLVQRQDATPINRYNLAVNLFNKARSLSNAENHEGAIEICKQGMETVAAAMEHRESYALYIRFYLLQGEEYEAMQRFGEAQTTFAKAVEICESPAAPQDIVTLKLKAEVLSSLGRVDIACNNFMNARRHLRAADNLYEELIQQFAERKLYRRRATVAFLDAQLCYMQCLMGGAQHNYEKCIEYMETYTDDEPEDQDQHILALASYLLGCMNRQSPNIALLKKAFTIWNELAKKKGGEQYTQYRDEVAAILVRHMFG